MSKLLISESPLQVIPSLAVAIGLNEAIVLQQIHYLLPYARTIHEGKKWVYKSIKEWQAEQFPFFSEDTLKRTIKNLREKGLIDCEKLSDDKYNRVNFYTINYENLNKIGCESSNNALGQNAPIEDSKMHQSTLGQNAPMLQENTQENTTEREAPTPKIFKAEQPVEVYQDNNSNFNPDRETLISKFFMAGIISSNQTEINETNLGHELYQFNEKYGHIYESDNQRFSRLMNWFKNIKRDGRIGEYFNEPQHSDISAPVVQAPIGVSPFAKFLAGSEA